MKNLKKLLIVFLILALALCLFACVGGKDLCKAHADDNGDGKCDTCGETVENPETTELTLIENGEANFQIVYSKDFGASEVYITNKIRNSLSKLDITVTSTIEKEDNIQECEILVGNITTRGDKYFYDNHNLGKEGYVFKIVDSKVIINAGSTETLTDAIEEFIEEVLGITKSTDSLTDVVMTSEQAVEEIQDDYRITSLAIDGQDMKGYTIAVDKANETHVSSAEAFQDAIYERTGYWFEIVDLASANKSVVFKKVAKDAIANGFKISTNSEKQLVIECGYDNKLNDAVQNFLTDTIFTKEDDVNLKGSSLYTEDISVVYYEDFGAKGDGVTDDFKALYDAHIFANISGQTVKAKSGKTYYIHETRIDGAVKSIPIMTNVQWGTAKFIIDDSDLSGTDKTKRYSNWIFQVESDYENITVTDATKLAALAGIGEGTAKLEGLGLGYPAMLTIYNDNHTVYRRLGSSYSGGGQSQHEVILVDKDGNVDESTPFMFDYAEVTKYVVHRTDVEPITLKGGIFTTKASSVNIYDPVTGEYPGDVYFARGICVSRPYTVLDGVEHYVTGEIPFKDQTTTNCGVAYHGFFYASATNDVLFKDLILTGRRCYMKSVGGTMGTYDFGAEGTNKIRLEGCIQSNFYLMASADMGVTTTYKEVNGDVITFGVEVEKDNGTREKMPGFTVTKNSEGIPSITPKENAVLSLGDNPSPAKGQICWGIGGTNFCKNMEYINSVLSRYDAHCGLLNGKVVGTTINYFAMVGKGDFIVEDTTWIAPSDGANFLIFLRNDYGSPWEGTITIKDTVAVNYKDSTKEFGLIVHAHDNWDFGYTCYFPNIVIDNLTFGNFANGATVNLIYPGSEVISQDIHLDTIDGAPNKNPVVPPEFIKIVNNNNGYKYYLPDNNFFKETELIGSVVQTK